MKRKVISAVLAGACAVSALSFSAAAATSSKTSDTQTVDKLTTITYDAAETTIISPVLNVTLPATDKIAVVLNPYGLESSGGVKYDGGIASPVYKVRNLTEGCQVKITATAKITAPSSVTIQPSKGDLSEEVDKKIYAYLSGKTATLDYDKSFTKEAEAELENEQTVVFSASGKTGELMTLPGADGTTSSKGVFTPTSYGYGEFKVTGDISTGAPDQWKDTDNVSVEVVFDVAPVPKAKD